MARRKDEDVFKGETPGPRSYHVCNKKDRDKINEYYRALGLVKKQYKGANGVISWRWARPAYAVRGSLATKG